jgi:hypothetical protein
MRAAGVVGIPETAQAFAALGAHINQPDLPHWAVQIIGWLRMVKSINEDQSREGLLFQTNLKDAFENGAAFDYTNEKTGVNTAMRGPAAVYAIYQSYAQHLEIARHR